MTRTAQTLPAETGGTDVTRFNALRHGVLSRYAVLPWEDADEYHALVAALAAEHAPQGPTEEHLVEETGRHPVAQAAASVGRGRRPSARARRDAGALPRDSEAALCASPRHRSVRAG